MIGRTVGVGKICRMKMKGGHRLDEPDESGTSVAAVELMRGYESAGEDPSITDLEVALMFLEDFPESVYVVQDVKEIPYLKRALVKQLGTPDNHYGHSFKYGQHRIHIKVEHMQSLDEYEPRTCFLINTY